MMHTPLHDDVVFDVGMHKGEDTDYYLKKGFRVIGFEADPALIAFCRDRFSGAIGQGTLIVVEGAITNVPLGGNRSKTIKFYRNLNKSVWGTISPEWARRNELLRGTTHELIEVSAVDFSECLAKYGVPHYMKTDIEGMDTVCLRSLSGFEQRPSYVSMEVDKDSLSLMVERVALCTQLGYAGFKVVAQGGVRNQREPSPSKEGAYVGYEFQKGSSGVFGEDLPHEWMDHDQILRECKSIFRQYKMLGGYRRLKKYDIGIGLGRALSMLLGRPFPGWHDLHARHSSVVL